MLPVGPQYGFGLYVHWPYCSKICPYCDFNVYAAKARDTAPLVAAIQADIHRHRTELPDHPPLDSVFFGGGTPSLLPARDIAAIIDTARSCFDFKPGAEISLEANPNDILAADLPDWAAAGINRLSIGVQSLNDDALTFLGRDHDSAGALRALELAACQFDNHSIDLIYALPGQSIEAWQAELTAATSLAAPHLSLYELTIAERTAFWHQAARGDLIPMNDDAQADLYEATQAICNRAGLPAYEVSNHARAPQYQSVHNHIYWNSGDWIGVGPGAHGRLTKNHQRLATEAARRPADYIAGNSAKTAVLPPLDIARELLSMGLRPASGLDLSRVEALTGTPINAQEIQSLVDNGVARWSAPHLALTELGRLLADHITTKLAP